MVELWVLMHTSITNDKEDTNEEGVLCVSRTKEVIGV